MPGFENFERDIERDAIAATDKIKRENQKHPKQPLSLTERARAAGYRTDDDDNFLADEVLPARPHTPSEEILPGHLLEELDDNGKPAVPPPTTFDPRVFLPKKRP